MPAEDLLGDEQLWRCRLTKRAAELSCQSGGIVKSDLKAFDEILSLSLAPPLTSPLEFLT